MLTKLKNKLLKSIKSRKLNVFGLFFLLAFIFLIVTKLSKTYTETIPLKISYVNLPEEHSLITTKDSVVKVVVKSYGFNLLPYVLFSQSLKIDFKNDVSLKNNQYVWQSKQNIQTINKQFKNSVEILSVRPDSLVFPFQTLTVKMVPVRLNSKIDFALGYDVVDNIKIKPDSVKVIGPKNLVSKVDYVNTKTLTLKNVNTSFEKVLTINFRPKDENVYLSEKSIKVSGEVGKFTEGLLEIPVSITNLPANTNINFFPKTITVIYYVSLDNYSKIKATDFKVECDFAEINNSNRTFLTPKLVKTPIQIKSARLKQDKVEFILMQ